MNRIEQIQQRLQQKLQAQDLQVIDDSAKHQGHAGSAGGAGHFTVIMASPLFDNQSTLACHRLIYDALADMMHTDIHALSIKIIKS